MLARPPILCVNPCKPSHQVIYDYAFHVANKHMCASVEIRQHRVSGEPPSAHVGNSKKPSCSDQVGLMQILVRDSSSLEQSSQALGEEIRCHGVLNGLVRASVFALLSLNTGRDTSQDLGCRIPV